MSVSSEFLWRFLDDVWDLLPTDDRKLFEAYWKAQIRLAGHLQQKVLELAASTTMEDVPVFLTDRWSRYVMNSSTCDLFDGSQVMTLTGTNPVVITRETVLSSTVVISNPSKLISYQEPIQFFDGSVRSLRYGLLVRDTVSVKNGDLFEFVENRDYVLNLIDGTIQALPEGRLPEDESVTVYYKHAAYERDLDYVFDEATRSVARTASSQIGSGTDVTVFFTYNSTPTLPLSSSSGVTNGTSLVDAEANFGSLLPGRTLTILSGPNAGTYAVSAIVSSTELQMATAFPAVVTANVEYTINAFPQGIRVDKAIASIPTLQNRLDDPTVLLVEGIDYIVSGGILAMREAPPLSDLGPVADREAVLWAEVTRVNKETPYRNFGVLIDFYRTNSEAYKLALQGLWYAFWTGSTPNNQSRGLHILLGLPYAKVAGTVVSVTSSTIQIKDARGRVLSYDVPAGLDPVVAVDDEVARFASLTTGVQIIDRNNEPGFVAARLGRPGIERFLTMNATRGPGNTDETKALTLLENHLFIPQVLSAALSRKINVTELTTFLDNIKPKWTTYIFAFGDESTETMRLIDDDSDGSGTFGLSLSIDLTTTVHYNEVNVAFERGFIVDRTGTGEIITGGTQATGNFRDPGVNFATLGIDTGDYVRISNTAFRGYWRVLKRISSSTLSLEIPDASIFGTLGIDFIVLQEEFLLGHDAVQMKHESTILVGTQYTAPSILNTKTDANFLQLKSSDVKALLLIDITNTGAEVQSIIAADVFDNEIEVATPPSVAVQGHKIASAALVRTDNSGPTVTHAFAI